MIIRRHDEERRTMTTAHAWSARARVARPRSSGQALMYVTLFLFVLVALVGLGVDGGSLYLNRRGMQVAADAAALAGARVMGTGDSTGADIRGAIDQYAAANLVDQPSQNVSAYYTDITGARLGTVDGSGTAPVAAVGVEVTTTKQAPTYFLPILGINSFQVQAIAGARSRPAPGAPVNFGIFALAANLPPGNKVLDWSGGQWTVSGIIHSNSDIDMSGNGNTINGSVEYVTGVKPTGLKNSATLNPSTNNPIQSTVLADPINLTPADFYQGTTSTATYHYISGNTNLSSYVVSGVLQPGVYYVDGSINFSTGLSTTVASNVTLVTTGSINIASPSMNFTPYSRGLTFFANVTTNNVGLNISGSTGSWTGAAYAPHSNLQFSGSSNMAATGNLIGYTVHISGTGVNYVAGSMPGSPGPAEIVLYE